MLESQTHLVRLSELRSAINAHDGEDAEALAKLEAEHRATEAKYRLAIQTESEAETRAESDGEDVELRQLQDKASVGRIVEGVVSGRGADGAERELQQHIGISSNAIPISMLEERAAATFSGTGREASQAALVPTLFPRSAAVFANVAIEQVPAGLAQRPVLTTGATATTPAAGAAAAESTGEITVTTHTPRRIQAGLSYRIENAAQFSSLDADLRMELAGALQDKLDDRILNTTNKGLLDFGTDPSTPGATTTFDQFLDAAFSAVDGTDAVDASQVRMLLGSRSFADMAKAYRGADSDGRSALESIEQRIGGVRVSGNVPAYASNFQDGVVIRTAGMRNAVASIWPAVEVIVDPYTKKAEGERGLTAVLLYDFSILRASGYVRERFR